MMLYSNTVNTGSCGDCKSTSEKKEPVNSFSEEQNVANGSARAADMNSGFNAASKYCFYMQDLCPNRVIEYTQLLSLSSHENSTKEATASTNDDISVNTAKDNVVVPSLSSASPDFERLIGSNSIICFPLKPKPHEVTWEWVKSHWGRGEE